MGTRAIRRATFVAIVAVAGLLAGCAAVPGADDPIEEVPRRSATTVRAPAAGPAVPSPGCESGDVAPFDGQRTLAGGEKPREYLFHVPPNLQPGQPVPLVLDLHSIGVNAALQSGASAWNQLADQAGLIVAHPQGINNIWQFVPDDANPDLIFLRELLGAISAERCVDLSRVYAAGWSMGGLMASALACKASDQIAAFGFVSGMQWKPECEPASPRPAVVFWGSKDCVLPWFGTMGPCLAIGPPGRTQPTAPAQPGQDMGFPPVETVLKDWSTHNGCTDQPVSEQLTASVTHRVYQGCKPGAELELFFIEGGGHAWPGSKLMQQLEQARGPDVLARQGITTDEIDATQIMWAFFTQYQLPA